MDNTLANVDNKANKVCGDMIILRSFQIIPELLAIAQPPAIGSLINGDKKSLSAIEKFEESISVAFI